MTRVLKVYRAERFSPNSVDRDRAIIDAVGRLLAVQGCAVDGVNEEQLTAGCTADIILTMARTPQALGILRLKESGGCTVVNRPDGVAACGRSNIDRLMRSNGLPAAPEEGCEGYWIKRGDEAAQCRGDVVFARNGAERDEALRRFHARGVGDVVVTAHVPGDVVKFYGVVGTGFFRTFHTDADYSKFGDEMLNGVPKRYGFSVSSLKADAERLACLAGVDVYGGDCIVREDGSYAIIDFNDWPSFARCRDEAAAAIAMKVEAVFKGKKEKS